LEDRVLLSGPTAYTVNLTTDSGTGSGNTGDLRYVINQANVDPNPSGSVITFSPTVFATPQTITLSPTLGALDLSEAAGPEVIQGPGPSLVTISGGQADGLFHVDSAAETATGTTATLSGLTIAAGGPAPPPRRAHPAAAASITSAFWQLRAARSRTARPPAPTQATAAASRTRWLG